MACILVIDDDPVICQLIAAVLEARGHSVVSVGDGKEGTAAFDEQVDLVVTDIVMPEQDGIATIVAIRRKSRTVPILAISASETVGRPGDYLRAAQALGATSTLAKPLDQTRLVDTVERMLGCGTEGAAPGQCPS